MKIGYLFCAWSVFTFSAELADTKSLFFKDHLEQQQKLKAFKYQRSLEREARKLKKKCSQLKQKIKIANQQVASANQQYK